MATSPSASNQAVRKDSFATGAVIASLLVPLMTVCGAVVSWYVPDIHNDWVDRQQEVCRRMPAPTAEFVAAWAGPILGISAVVVCVLLAKLTRRRFGLRIWETRWGLLAYIGVWPNVLALMLELFTLYATYSPVDSGPILGDCR
ncbi:hypothetical protein ABZ545_20240 [Streptomyces abikoensis]|uniref:hypothetical protein n=1 Tax=Streptomyces abikoensis TaxID=97398 RepID=UPI0033E7DC12